MQPNTTTQIPTIKGIYTAVLSQTGTNPPTPQEQQNTIGELIYGYTSTGNYTILLPYETPNKIIILTSQGYSKDGIVMTYLSTNDTIVLQYSNAGTLINDWVRLNIQIITYN